MLEKNTIPLLNQPQTLCEPFLELSVGKISAQDQGEPPLLPPGSGFVHELGDQPGWGREGGMLLLCPLAKGAPGGHRGNFLLPGEPALLQVLEFPYESPSWRGLRRRCQP